MNEVIRINTQEGFIQGALMVGIALLFVIGIAVATFSSDTGIKKGAGEAQGVGASLLGNSGALYQGAQALSAASTVPYDGVGKDAAGRLALVTISGNVASGISVPDVTPGFPSAPKGLEWKVAQKNASDNVYAFVTGVDTSTCKQVNYGLNGAATVITDPVAAGIVPGSPTTGVTTYPIGSALDGNPGNGCYVENASASTGVYIYKLL